MDADSPHTSRTMTLPEPSVASGRSWMSRVVVVVVAVGVVFVLVRMVGRIDVEEVWAALTRLPWWSPLLLLPLLMLRQVLNTAPLALFIPGTGLYRCTVNDLSAGTAAAFAPAPSDGILRVAMFRTWGSTPTRHSPEPR